MEGEVSGRCMMIVAAAGLALIAQGTGAADLKRPTDTSVARTIPLFQSEGRVLVMMRLNGSEPMPMVFDTGSDGNSIDNRVVRARRLPKVGDAIEVDGTTGKRRFLPVVALDRATLGGVPAGRLEASALPYDYADAMGIISSENFKDSLVYLELSKSRVRLVPRTTAVLPASKPTPYVESIATTDLVLPDGGTIPAHFDTGYDAPLSLPISMMDKVPLYAPARVIGRFKSINTEGEVFGGRIKGRVRIGPVTLDDPEVSFLGDLANIGLPVIRQMTLVLDPANQRSWVLPPEG